MTVLTRLLRSSRKALGSRQEPLADSGDTPVGASQFLLTEHQIRDRVALAQLVHEIDVDGGTYHQLNLRPDLSIVGDYDMRRYVSAYHIPDDLSGLRVLDVGTAAGYFALECARRGADVVAIDLMDAPPLAHITRLADLRIRYVKMSVYDLDASFGQFDVVICGSLLLHVTDMFSAIRALRTVCRGRLCISTACTDDSGRNSRPMCDFIADKAADGHYYTYWLASEAVLRQMLLVSGFARVANEGHFCLESNRERQHFATPHVVMTAFVE
jgi:tRNA (mo5U34)-methyltransferase